MVLIQEVPGPQMTYRFACECGWETTDEGRRFRALSRHVAAVHGQNEPIHMVVSGATLEKVLDLRTGKGV